MNAIVKTPLSEMEFYQVSQLVNSVRNQGEDIILSASEYKDKKKKAFFSLYKKKEEEEKKKEESQVLGSESKEEGRGESFALQRRKQANRKEKRNREKERAHRSETRQW